MRFNRKSVYVSVPATQQPLSLTETKSFLRIDTSDDDLIVLAYIQTATEAIKQYLRRSIMTETYVFKADGFAHAGADDRLLALGPGVHTASVPYVLGGGETLDLPFAPLQSVTSVVTYDRSNNASTLDASTYQVDLQSGRIYLNEGETWPSDLRAQDAVQVTYVAGYTTATIPAPIREAIRRYVESLYEGCEGMTDEIKRLLAPYRRMDELAW